MLNLTKRVQKIENDLKLNLKPSLYILYLPSTKKAFLMTSSQAIDYPFDGKDNMQYIRELQGVELNQVISDYEEQKALSGRIDVDDGVCMYEVEEVIK